jgi:uncharacterized protein YodC (DUF2158 family)
MASVFKKGDVVRVTVVVPQGPVQSIRMDEDGNVQYLISWTNGDKQEERWFDESVLVTV